MDDKKVVLGLSDGVDSAVAAKVLKDGGYEVYGLYLNISGEEAGLAAKRSAQTAGIHFASAEIADALLEKYPDSNIILTLGGDGCIFKSAEQTLRQGIFKVEPADTTAAGDTFTGYFLARIGAGETVAQALKLASAASAIVVSRVGASSSIPTLEETRTFVEKF